MSNSARNMKFNLAGGNVSDTISAAVGWATDMVKDAAAGFMDGMQLYKYVLGSFEEVSDCFTVFEEIAQGFSGIDNEAFRAVQSKKGWQR